MECIHTPVCLGGISQEQQNQVHVYCSTIVALAYYRHSKANLLPVSTPRLDRYQSAILVFLW